MNLSTDTIEIRMATPDDAHELERLAQLDSAELPVGPMLLAECDGRLQAALALRDGSSVSDPFAPTAELLALLRLRAARLTAHASVAARLRGALAGRRHPRAFAA
jgi:hypothetical protein